MLRRWLSRSTLVRRSFTLSTLLHTSPHLVLAQRLPHLLSQQRSTRAELCLICFHSVHCTSPSVASFTHCPTVYILSTLLSIFFRLHLVILYSSRHQIARFCCSLSHHSQQSLPRHPSFRRCFYAFPFHKLTSFHKSATFRSPPLLSDTSGLTATEQRRLHTSDSGLTHWRRW